jgi:phage terminase large subunit-like protein
MVEMSDELSRSLRCLRDAIECKATGSVYVVRSAEAGLSEGLSPTLTIFDEVHVQQTRDLWDTMQLGQGARPESLLLGITTAGVRTDRTGRPSLAFSLYEHGRRVASGEIDDPTFFFAWYEAPAEADWRDPETWRAANPGFGDLVAESDFASVVKRTPEAEFRIKRLNQWVASEAVWLPAGAWDACADSTRTIEDGAEVVLGFDGSYSHDSTALVAVTIPKTAEEKAHVELAGLWERGLDDGPEWRVPTDEVVDAIRACCDRWAVRELPADPSLWRDILEHLADEGVPVVEFPQSPSRMIPATQRLFEAVMERRLTHNGDPRLGRHIGNARTRISRGGGLQLTKGSFGHSSPRKIDAAVALVMAYERSQVVEEPGVLLMSGDTWLESKGGPGYLAELVRKRDEKVAEIFRRHREKGR